MTTLGEIETILKLKLESGADRCVEDVLCRPIQDIMDRPKKNLRGRLVRLGFSLTATKDLNPDHLSLGEQLIEAVHAGSLVIDDIQDNSDFRRGEPTLHRVYGVPIAINAGNWLYFWGMDAVRKMQLPAEAEVKLYDLYRETLLRAHLGQALDVGCKILSLKDEEIAPLCLRSLSLKSGALVAFAFGVGAIVNGVDEKPYLEFGEKFGTALQMFDDLGNARSRKDPEKHLEDLHLKRPSWVWAALFQKGSEAERIEFRRLMESDPEKPEIQTWVDAHGDLLSAASEDAKTYLWNSYDKLSGDREREAFQELHKIGEELVRAYG